MRVGACIFVSSFQYVWLRPADDVILVVRVVPLLQGIDNEVPVAELTISQVSQREKQVVDHCGCCCSHGAHFSVHLAGIRIGSRAVFAVVPQLNGEKIVFQRVCIQTFVLFVCA